MKNSLNDLNNYLFAQIERLDEEDLSSDAERLRAEIERSGAVCAMSQQIVAVNGLLLKQKLMLGKIADGDFDLSKV